MNRRRLVSAVAGALLVVPLMAAPAAAGTRRERDQQLQQLLDADRDSGVPGPFAQVRDGNQVWRGASGVADVVTRRPVHPWYQHRVGNIAKTFVAATVLQLVGEGKVGLDAPIAEYLPGVLPDPLGHQVTVRMLLNETSGIGNYSDGFFRVPDDLETMRHKHFTPAELVAIGLSKRRANPPGEAWAYSNTNYVIAGMLIERVTKRRYAAEVERRILRPLGLGSTYFPGDERGIRGPHANAYVPWPDDTLRDFTEYDMSWAWAAGEMISTPNDVNRFYRALLTGKVLRPALLKEMLKTAPTQSKVDGHGLGIHWVLTACGPMWGQDGNVVGQLTSTLHSVDATRQVTLAENLSFTGPPGLPHPIDGARARFLAEAACGSAKKPVPGTAAAAAADLIAATRR
jgi:D-alanyl-D-alanine carboxypeptidase